jgi:hypothetical protein
MEPTIQKPKMPGWKKGARIGAIVGVVAGIIGIVWLIAIGDSNDFNNGFDSELIIQIIVPIFNLGIVGFCLGGLIGRRFSKEIMPYWLKGAFVMTVLPVAFLIITAFQPNLGMGFMLVVAYLMFAPIPLFIAGSLLGFMVDKIIWKVRVRHHPELAITQEKVVSSRKGLVKRSFDYFLKP